jgi:ABC-2 type transport system ATP-binding protein
MRVVEPSIVVRDLRVVRGATEALRGVSLEVVPGQVTGLLGPSGSGKSTLIRSIVGVQRITAGAVSVLGLPAGSPPLRSRVAYVTQAPSVYADLTVRENLAFFARVLRATAGDVESAIGTVALDEHADQVVGTLSGGELARVSLATALLNRPEVLVLDEPTVGLDPLLRRDLWSTFRTLAEGGRTLLVSSHVMDEAERCDTLVLLREGRILALSTPAALRRETGATDLDAAFLALVERRAAP